MHSVAHHCLDVAAVAQELLPLFPPSQEGVPPSWITGIVALHDIGKFTRPFQAKVRALWPARLGPFAPEPAGRPVRRNTRASAWKQ